MHIVSLFSDSFSELNSTIYRTIIPASALRRAGHRVDVLHVHGWLVRTPQVIRSIAQADLVIIQRVAVQETIEHARFWRAHSKALAVDFDDDYQRIEEDNQAHKFWGKGEVEVVRAPGIKYTKQLEKHPIEALRELAGVCNAVTSPGRMLVEDWRRWGNAVYVPNYYDFGDPRWRVSRLIDPEWVTIGWGGSMSHLPSFRESGVMEGLRRLMLERKNVRFILAGDRRVYDELPLPGNRKLFQPYVPWTLYPGILSRWDIMIAPLAREYDQRRSALKLTEAAFMGVPVVATRGPVYEDFEREGIGLFVDNDLGDVPKEKRAEQWYLCLRELVDSPGEWKEKASHWRDYAVENYDVDVNTGKLAAVWHEVAGMQPVGR